MNVIAVCCVVCFALLVCLLCPSSSLVDRRRHCRLFCLRFWSFRCVFLYCLMMICLSACRWLMAGEATGCRLIYIYIFIYVHICERASKASERSGNSGGGVFYKFFFLRFFPLFLCSFLSFCFCSVFSFFLLFFCFFLCDCCCWSCVCAYDIRMAFSCTSKLCIWNWYVCRERDTQKYDFSFLVSSLCPSFCIAGSLSFGVSVPSAFWWLNEVCYMCVCICVCPVVHIISRILYILYISLFMYIYVKICVQYT